jgi:hypothetical protein
MVFQYPIHPAHLRLLAQGLSASDAVTDITVLNVNRKNEMNTLKLNKSKKNPNSTAAKKGRNTGNPTLRNKLTEALYGTNPQPELPTPVVVGDYTPTGFHLAGSEAVLSPREQAEVDELKALDDLDDNDPGDDNHTETTLPQPEAKLPDISGSMLSQLARRYLTQSIGDQKRTPSQSLTEAFRSRLLKFQAMFTHVAKVLPAGINNEITQFVTVVQALASENALEAIILIRNVMKQTLWHATLDYNRALRGNGTDGDADLPDSSDYSKLSAIDRALSQSGIIDRRDEMATPPIGLGADPLGFDEGDVINALIEVNGWLGTVADLVPTGTDEQKKAQRERLNLSNGLQYLDRPVEDPSQPSGRRWDPVYSPEEAIEVQQIANRVSMKKRQQREVQQKQGQFEALIRIAAGFAQQPTR